MCDTVGVWLKMQGMPEQLYRGGIIARLHGVAPEFVVDLPQWTSPVSQFDESRNTRLELSCGNVAPCSPQDIGV